MEPSVTVTFTAAELQALGNLLDVAVKASGIAGAKTALPIVSKLENAVAEHNSKKEDK